MIMMMMMMMNDDDDEDSDDDDDDDYDDGDDVDAPLHKDIHVKFSKQTDYISYVSTAYPALRKFLGWIYPASMIQIVTDKQTDLHSVNRLAQAMIGSDLKIF